MITCFLRGRRDCDDPGGVGIRTEALAFERGEAEGGVSFIKTVEFGPGVCGYDPEFPLAGPVGRLEECMKAPLASGPLSKAALLANPGAD